MKPSPILLLCALLMLPSYAFSQTAKEEGKRLGVALKPMIEGMTRAPVNADTVPGFQTDNPSEQSYFDNPSNMAASATGLATSDPAAVSLQDSMALRPVVETEAVEAFLGLGFEAQNNVETYVSGFSGEYGECVEIPVGDGPDTYYIRTCNEGLAIEHTPAICLIPLTHKFNEIYGYQCRLAGTAGTLPVCDFTVFSACMIVDVRFECGGTAFTFCDFGGTTVLELTYECGAEVAGYSPAYTKYDYVSSAPDDTACHSLTQNARCSQTSETCIEGPETRTVNDVEVTQNCWKWQRRYDCIDFHPASDCALAEEDPACIFDHQDCLSVAEDGSCDVYEKFYHCTVPGGPTGEVAVSCGEDIYCLDGSCDSITREANSSFPEAAAALQMMAQQSVEFDKTDYTIFDGDNLTCPKTLFGVVNCCSHDGFLVDIGLVGCDGEARALAEKSAAGLCHYIGTYCSSKIFGICIKKRKSYCCFKGKLSRLIMEQGREQLGISWGEAKEPNCEGFTVAQFQSLDFSQMDLSEFYADAQATVVLREDGSVIDDLQRRIETYYDR